MKILLGLILLMGLQAFAGLSEDLSSCQRSCNPGCVQLVHRTQTLLNEIQDNCSGQIDSYIVNACSKAFVYTSDQKTCVQTASNAESVKACYDAFVYTNEKLDCVGKARSDEVVKACVKTFVYTKDKLQCIENARSAALVQTCSEKFVYTQDKLDCMKSWRP